LGTASVVVNPGICGLQTSLSATDRDGALELQAQSACPRVKAFAETLPGADTFALALNALPQNPAALAAEEHRLHAGCAVPIAVIKLAEVCGGLALPARAEIEITSTSQ
jgi:hypothetical protein